MDVMDVGESGNSISDSPQEKKNGRGIIKKSWRFTWFSDDLTKDVLDVKYNTLLPDMDVLVMGLETCPDTKRLHIQGFFRSKKQIRAHERYRDILPQARFFAADKGDIANIRYCTKEENVHYRCNVPVPEPVRPIYDHLEHVQPWPFQQHIINIAKNWCEPTDRKITWIYGNGRLGKSILAKHLCLKYKFIFVNGAGKDIYTFIAEYLEKNNGEAPRGILYGFPKDTDPKHVSYASMEVIKDGIFFSPKYKSTMCVFNTPHIVVLCNFYPLRDKLIEDRWDIYRIKDDDRTLIEDPNDPNDRVWFNPPP